MLAWGEAFRDNIKNMWDLKKKAITYKPKSKLETYLRENTIAGPG